MYRPYGFPFSWGFMSNDQRLRYIEGVRSLQIGGHINNSSVVARMRSELWVSVHAELLGLRSRNH